MNVREIPLEKLFIKKNIRTDTDEELGEQMQSMARYGQLQPIGVYPRGERFEIVFGHRRFRAAQMNNERTIACHVLNVPESAIPIIKLQENTVRKQMTNDEILAAADAIKAARPDLTDCAISLMLGKSRGWLAMRRGARAAYDRLLETGFDEAELKDLRLDQLLKAGARLNSSEPVPRATRYRRAGVPSEGLKVLSSDGPNVVVVCASRIVKRRVVSTLKKLAREIT